MKKIQYIKPEAVSVTLSPENEILQASLLIFALDDGVAAESYNDIILGAW